MSAVLPTERAILDESRHADAIHGAFNAVCPKPRKKWCGRHPGFLEGHLASIRDRSIMAGKQKYPEAERLVLDATETAYAAGVLRQMCVGLPVDRTRCAR